MRGQSTRTMNLHLRWTRCKMIDGGFVMNRTTCSLLFVMAVLALVAAGGAEIGADGRHYVSTGPKAECLVCKHNADLACVDVEVKADTPRYVYEGKTYYFCSDGCRD